MTWGETWTIHPCISVSAIFSIWLQLLPSYLISPNRYLICYYDKWHKPRGQLPLKFSQNIMLGNNILRFYILFCIVVYCNNNKFFGNKIFFCNFFYKSIFQHNHNQPLTYMPRIYVWDVTQGCENSHYLLCSYLSLK